MESPEETLTIKNFAGIKEATITLGSMNVFIGPQASGKSVCAKLFYYFKQIASCLPEDVVKHESIKDIHATHYSQFSEYFPQSSWGANAFEIEYQFGALKIKAARKVENNHEFRIHYSTYWNSLLENVFDAKNTGSSNLELKDFMRDQLSLIRDRVDLRVRQDIGSSLTNTNYFIPAGRSFFHALQDNVFALIAGDIDIDPFILEFGRIYERAKKTYFIIPVPERRNNEVIDKYISTILCGQYMSSPLQNFILMNDGREIPVSTSSSGQQEALPLALLLSSIGKSNRRANQSTLFVEEPEAHLFPIAQNEMVGLISKTLEFENNISSSQCIITTHSPYILTSLNNLMYGSKIASDKPDHKGAIKEILGNVDFITSNKVRAYAFANGDVRSIIDKDTGLVLAKELDGVSSTLANAFHALMEIEFAEEAA